MYGFEDEIKREIYREKRLLSMVEKLLETVRDGRLKRVKLVSKNLYYELNENGELKSNGMEASDVRVVEIKKAKALYEQERSLKSNILLLEKMSRRYCGYSMIEINKRLPETYRDVEIISQKHSSKQQRKHSSTQREHSSTQGRQARTQAEQSSTQSEHSSTQSEQSSTQGEQSSTQGRQARTQAEHSSTQSRQASTQSEHSSTQAEPTSTQGRQARTQAEHSSTQSEESSAQGRQARTQRKQLALPVRTGHTAADGTKLRSMAEVVIYNLLKTYDIPFRYEETLTLGIDANQITLLPDFTIYRKDGRKLYWEHIGMFGNIEYKERFIEKLEKYYEHGIVPGSDLIMTFSKSDMSVDSAEIDRMIRQFILPVVTKIRA